MEGVCGDRGQETPYMTKTAVAKGLFEWKILQVVNIAWKEKPQGLSQQVSEEACVRS